MTDYKLQVKRPGELRTTHYPLSTTHHLPPAGFTLIEMLVVMAIAAILAGLTVASFVAAGRRSSREGAAENIMGILRQARIAAVDSGRGAVVRIDPSDRSIYGLARKVIAAWHLDEIDTNPDPDETPGAKGIDGYMPTGTSIWSGRGAVGLCMDFDGSGDYMASSTSPVLDQTDGIRLEAYVRPDATDLSAGDELGVFTKVDHSVDLGYGLWLEYEGNRRFTVHGIVHVEDNPDADDDPEVIVLDSGGVEINADAWSHVILEFDGFEARLMIRGVLVDLDSYRANETQNPTDDPNTSTNEHFARGARMMPARTINFDVGRYHDGTGFQYFQGQIDEPVVLSVAGGERVRLPERVPLVTSDLTLHFNGQGFLDLSRHAGSVYIGLGDPHQSAALATGGDGGTILTLGVRNPFPSGRGVVMLGSELIEYGQSSGLTLSEIDNSPGGDRYDYDGGFADDQVRWARVIRVGPTGLIERIRRMP